MPGGLGVGAVGLGIEAMVAKGWVAAITVVLGLRIRATAVAGVTAVAMATGWTVAGLACWAPLAGSMEE